MFPWRENSGAFHAEVVVFNHPPGLVSNPNRILAGIPNLNFILAQNRSRTVTPAAIDERAVLVAEAAIRPVIWRKCN
jgi:hypothetical protein